MPEIPHNPFAKSNEQLICIKAHMLLTSWSDPTTVSVFLVLLTLNVFEYNLINDTSRRQITVTVGLHGISAPSKVSSDMDKPSLSFPSSTCDVKLVVTNSTIGNDTLALCFRFSATLA
jgi:hypothetical protein